MDLRGGRKAEPTAAQKRAADEAKESAKILKRAKTSISAAAEELLCPISTDLPIEPVTAEDGRVYERELIETHIKVQGNRVKSPVTNAAMGKKVFPAIHIRNAIQYMIDSGIIDGELADTWTARMNMKKKVEEATEKAAEGDAKAMCKLGDWHLEGENELPKDEDEAYKWYKKAADKNDVEGKRKFKELDDKRKVKQTKERLVCPW